MALAEDVLWPDYEYTVYEVYTKFIQQVVRKTANLDIICSIIPKVNNLSLQSRTPDWWSEPTSFCRHLSPESDISCAAAKCSRAEVIPSGLGNLETYKAFFKTVCFGRVIDGFPLMAFISATNNFIALTATNKTFLKNYEVLTDSKIQIPQISEATKEQLENQVLSILRMVIKDRRFSISSSGRIGMAPAEADIGDKICILLGCSFLVILRPSNDSKHFTLISEAYLHEYIAGSGIDELEKGKRTLQKFGLL